ncbi:MAG: hypothetical protein ACHQIK_17280 [Candidatus Acidiferrales bacterium]
MIPAEQIAGVLNPRPRGKRYMALLRFFCDESYDSDPNKGHRNVRSKAKTVYVPKTYVVAGFLANEFVWGKIEKPWLEKNKEYGVSRFHAAYVNARDGEFAGWSKPHRDSYVLPLLGMLQEQGRYLHAISVGMYPRDYEKIINPHGRRLFGTPYIACFKTCVVLIAHEMELMGLPREDKFAVVFDRNEFESDAVKIFYALKDNPAFPLRHRLATCAPGGWEEFVPLQCADMIAYDTHRLLEDKKVGMERTRKSLESLYSKNSFMGFYFEQDLLRSFKEPLENAKGVDNGFIVTPRPLCNLEQYETFRKAFELP